MSDPERYRSAPILREETLYYDLGYRFANINGRKPQKAFHRDVLNYLLILTLLIQVVVGVSQLFSLIFILIFLGFKYFSPDIVVHPIFMGLLVVGHVFDYTISGFIALPGQLIQNNLTMTFWIAEIVWIVILGYQILTLYQPHTPVIAKGQSVKPETTEAESNYEKMKLRLLGSDFTVDPLEKIIDSDKLSAVFIDLIKNVLAILTIIVILDMAMWRIVSNLGGGTNIEEMYIISGMSLVLMGLIIGFSNYMVPDEEEQLSDIPKAI